MALNPKWIAKQIKNSDKELTADVDSDEDRRSLDRMQQLHETQVAELRANPMALARMGKVYFTAEELYLAYGKGMKPSDRESVEKLKPELLTKYDEIKATNTDEEFWEEVSRIEGHWTAKR